MSFLVEKYQLLGKIKGILHVGAHECEELEAYRELVPSVMQNVLWIEALPDKVIECRGKFPGIQIEQAIVSDKKETVEFHVANNGQSSSILPLGLHTTYHPHIHYTAHFRSETQMLRDLLPKYPHLQANFLELDIQGAELKALQGMEEYLPNVDYIYTEVNGDYIYEGCALVGELDAFLSKYGFTRVETKWTEYLWGDAFYVKSA